MACQGISRTRVAVDSARVWRHLGGAGEPRAELCPPAERTVRALRRRVAPGEVADPWLARRLRAARGAVFVLAVAEPRPCADAFARHLEHAVACAALRQYAACCEARLRAEAAPWAVSRRWSPGTLGWDLGAGQREVFARLDAAALGVRVLESGCMQPAHAWSMVWGVGRFDGGRVSECAGCGDRGCPVRAGEGGP